MTSLAAAKLFDLSGAVALVTGGGTGIGLMCARALAANGATVYITGRRGGQVSRAASEHGAKLEDASAGAGALIALEGGDVTSAASLRALARELGTREGRLHILVNNAGVSGPKTKLDEPAKMDAQQYADAHLDGAEGADGWADVFTTNVTGVFQATMALLPLLERGARAPPEGYTRNHPRTAAFAPYTSAVLNVTSISGRVKVNQGHYAYNASKAAASHLTQMLAHELRFAAQLPVRVNAIAPGVFPSEMTTGGESGTSRKGTGLTAKETEGLNDKAGPPGRVGTEEDMAGLCLLLATNQYVHGQVVAIDGGFTADAPSAR